jgi:hypothetical protein
MRPVACVEGAGLLEDRRVGLDRGGRRRRRGDRQVGVARHAPDPRRIESAFEYGTARAGPEGGAQRQPEAVEQQLLIVVDARRGRA